MLVDNSNFREAEHIGEDLLNSSGANMDSKCRSVERAVAEGVFSLEKALKLYKVPEQVYYSFVQKKNRIQDQNQSFAPVDPKLQTTAPEENMTDALHELFFDELKDIYWAEKHLVKALPKMRKASASLELAAAFDRHTAETQDHIETLEKVFEILGEKAMAKKCYAMEGLLKEAEEIIAETEPGTTVREVGLISAAQKMEHYEIASYGTLKTLASTLGHTDVSNLLVAILENEKATDSLLTTIAENLIDLNVSSNLISRNQKLTKEKSW